MAPSGVAGDPALWLDTFPDGLIPEIVQLAVDVWKALPRVSSDEWEVPITRRFCAAMKRDKDFRRLPLRIQWEAVELDFETGEELGRIDLKFLPAVSAREEVYFAFECKRLNVAYGDRVHSLADKYVTEGVVRFVTAAYAGSMASSGMIGYVMDGRVRVARKAVGHAVRSRSADLHINPPDGLRNSTLSTKGQRVDESRHSLGVRAFTLYHLFLAY